MLCCLRVVIMGVSVLLLSFTAYGKEVSREQIKGLDEQVQEIVQLTKEAGIAKRGWLEDDEFLEVARKVIR